MTNRLPLLTLTTIAAVAERTATGQGSAVDVATLKDQGQIVVLAESVSGTGRTLDVTIEHSEDGSTGWADSGLVFTQVGTSDADEAVQAYVDSFRRYIRAAWTIAGTSPVFRFGVALLSR